MNIVLALAKKLGNFGEIRVVTKNQN